MPSLMTPGALPTGAVAALTGLFLEPNGSEICGITRSSGRWLPGSLEFSAAATAALRVGCLEAAVKGAAAEAGGEGGEAGAMD